MANEPLRILTAFHLPFYAPVYLAQRLGLFAEEGLAVTIATPEPGGTVDALASGDAEIALSGVMRAHVRADQPDPQRFLAIAEVNSRDGFFLLSRAPVGEFHWDDLAGKRLILFAEAPTPWMCLQDVLRRSGVDKERITLIPGLPVPQAINTLLAGEGDYLQAAQPMAEELVEDGRTYLAAAMAPAVGPVPFSSLIVTAEFRDRRPDLCARAVTALARAQRWMAAEDPARIAEVIAPDFPAIRPGILRKVVTRYHAAGTWPAHPLQDRDAFERFARMLVEGGLVRRAVPFEAVADNTFAEAAITDLA